ncbi:hypothetical protein ACU6U9_00935 [Pseudomonas sp. HK3]
MNNNNKNEQIHKLEREIWLFEQWLQSIDGQVGDTQARIRHAYKECITSRKLELAKLLSNQDDVAHSQQTSPNQYGQ